jgi:hypothetical protein
MNVVPRRVLPVLVLAQLAAQAAQEYFTFFTRRTL